MQNVLSHTSSRYTGKPELFLDIYQIQNERTLLSYSDTCTSIQGPL